jgi:Tfp pilus assembly protein FimT
MEVLVVLVTIGVLAAVGTPFFLGMKTRSSVRADSNDIYAAFRFAQSEAVKRNESVCVHIAGSEFRVYVSGGTDLRSMSLRPGNNIINNDFALDPCFNARGLPSISTPQKVDVQNNLLTMRVELSPAGHVSSRTQI